MLKQPGISTRIRHVLTRPPERRSLPDTYLGSVKPVDPTFAFTILEEDMPKFVPPLASQVDVAFPYFTFRNTGASAVDVSVEITKNGQPFYTGTVSVPNGSNGTWNPYLYDIQVGDVIAVYAWSASELIWFRQCGIVVCPTRLLPQNVRTHRNVEFSGIDGSPHFAGGASYQMYFTWNLGSVPFYFDQWVSGDLYYGSWWSPKGSYIVRLRQGDDANLNGTVQYNNTVSTPYYNKNAMPTVIEYDVVEYRGD